MGAFLEPLGHGTFILRAGPHAHRYGDDYTSSGTVVTIKPGVAEVRGFSRRLDDPWGAVEILRDTKRCLKEAGFTEFRWERVHGKKTKMVTVKL